MKIYLASSWRNELYSAVLEVLRTAGHEVHDFRDGEHSFTWADIDADWERWGFDEYWKALQTPAAQAGLRYDMAGLDWCEVCVLLLPCGASAHTEAGWVKGQGKLVHVLAIMSDIRPELMYAIFDGLHATVDSLLDALACGEQARGRH